MAALLGHFRSSRGRLCGFSMGASHLWARRGALLLAFAMCSASICRMSRDEPADGRSAYSPTWGPRDRIVFCYPDSGLWEIGADGTGLRQLTGLHMMYACWSPDGNWIAASGPGGQIWLLSADGDSTRMLTETGKHWYPAFSPDGKQIAFSTPDSDRLGVRGLRVLDLETGAERQVYPYGLDPSWSPDATRLAFWGWVHQNDAWVGGADGCLATVDTSGADARLVFDPPRNGGLESPSFSPDGSKILFRSPYYQSAGVGQIWVINTDGSNARRLTKYGGCWPAWSPDGSMVVYTRLSYDAPSQEGSGDLYIMNADGSHARRLTFFNFNEK